MLQRHPHLHLLLTDGGFSDGAFRALSAWDGQTVMRLFRVLAGLERVPHGRADDEEEGRKDQIRGREAVPLGMPEWRVHAWEDARLVDQDHARDGQDAKGVERYEARTSRHASGLLDRLEMAR